MRVAQKVQFVDYNVDNGFASHKIWFLFSSPNVKYCMHKKGNACNS